MRDDNPFLQPSRRRRLGSQPLRSHLLLWLRRAIWRKLPRPFRQQVLELLLARGSRSVAIGAPPAAPVCVVGLLSTPTGIGEGARLCGRALAELGYEVLAVDASELLEGTRLERDEVPLLERGSGTVILHFNPDNLSSILTVLGRRRLRGKRIIGYWAWELPRIPDHWLPALEEVDEVWVPTRFVADAVRPFTGKPVRVVPHPVGQAPTGTSDRARFGFDSVFVVLCMFSATSSFERKNPIAAVRAFRQAFEDRSDRLLVLKVANADETPEEMEALLAAVGGAPNIRVEGRHMSDRERLDLIASADVLLSLHRAEGFGLVMAEAMLAGVPVIATGWSGNLDFIDDATGLLVPFRLVEATDRRGVYGTGQRWADPDVAAASGYLQALARDPGAFAAMRQRAKATVRERLGPAGFGRAVAGALLVPSPARAAPGVPAAAARAT